MNRFDDDLRDALSAEQPPEGFAGRVLARTKPSRVWMWGAAAAALVVLSVGPSLYRERVRQVEGEKAKEQLLVALRVTGSKLRDVQEHVTRVQQRKD